MTERELQELLEEGVEAMMHGDRPSDALTPELAELLGLAGELRDLPRAGLKEELAAMLAGQAARSCDIYGPPLTTEAQIEDRLLDLTRQPALAVHDLAVALSDLPEMSMRFLAQLDERTMVVSRLSTLSHWERHPGGDELLYVIEGAAEITTLTHGGPATVTMRQGDVFVCPQGLWHRTLPLSPLSLLTLTPADGTEHTGHDVPPPSEVAETFVEGSGAAASPVPHGIREALEHALRTHISPDTTEDEAAAAFPRLTSMGRCGIFAGSFSGQSPWERHPDGDELLHVLEGDVEVTVLTEDGEVRVDLTAGSVFVCPRGLWHRQLARPRVTALYATPSDSTEVSFAHDPRVA